MSRRIYCITAIALALLATSAAHAQVIGSATIDRANIDLASGGTYIYAGGNFDALQRVTTFSFYVDGFDGSRFLTPVLFENVGDDVFAVRGIGTGRTVTSSDAPQAFAFAVQTGTDVTANGNFTFGFVNSLVNGTGAVQSTSQGATDFKEAPIAPGSGLSAGSTNRFVFTLGEGVPNIAPGTTFGRAGTGATYTNLNDPQGTGFNGDRTYSANLAAVAVVPEASTFALALPALGMVGAVVIRRRKK